MVTKRNEKGYPLNEDGSIDWELYKREIEKQCNDLESKKRNRMTHLTPKKKKRK